MAADGVSSRLQRLIERFPEPVRPHLEDSIARLSNVRSVDEGLAALQAEIERIIRLGVPLFLKRQYLRRGVSATLFAGAAGAAVAAAEEADELAALLSLGTAAAPGTATVVALGLLASAAEVYAATCARAAQLEDGGLPQDPDRIAEDVRLALFGTPGVGSGARSLARRAGRSGVTRLARRWFVGAVPVVGVAYGAWDSGRTVRRVLALPLPRVGHSAADGGHALGQQSDGSVPDGRA